MFSAEEILEIKNIINSITTHIPEHQMGWVWNTYNVIKGGTAGPQPCACGSSAKYWRAAVEEIRNYVKDNG